MGAVIYLKHRAAAPRAAAVVAAGPDGAGVGVDERRLGGGEGLLEARLAVDLAVGGVHGLCEMSGGVMYRDWLKSGP